MPRLGQRRLPQRLDYTLIPAPLDLSFPIVDEKSTLPAIIVTPSSPTSQFDFSIAFLAQPPKPTIRERLSSSVGPLKLPSLPCKARSMIFILIMIFVMVCHVVTHRLATRRPHLEASVQTGEAHFVDSSINWFDFRSLMDIPPDVKDTGTIIGAVSSS